MTTFYEHNIITLNQKNMNKIRFQLKNISLLLLVFIPFGARSQTDKPAYQLYSPNGKTVSYKSMINDFASADVVFIGEFHNNPISHWMELEITRSLYEKENGKIVLGAEMFESDTQLMLTEYVDSLIATARFEADMRLWKNYITDYKPLVEFARKKKIPFVATNIPRRYADVVNKSGGELALNTFSDEARRYIAPLPVPFKADSVMLREISGAGMMGSKNPLSIAKAQAVKDATMAWFIAQNAGKGNLFVHFNGSFHSDNRNGILYFLNIYHPKLKVKTLTTVEQNEVDELDKSFKNKADYILCVPATMTKTY